jgi:hypothetical protein
VDDRLAGIGEPAHLLPTFTALHIPIADRKQFIACHHPIPPLVILIPASVSVIGVGRCRTPTSRSYYERYAEDVQIEQAVDRRDEILMVPGGGGWPAQNQRQIDFRPF